MTTKASIFSWVGLSISLFMLLFVIMIHVIHSWESIIQPNDSFQSSLFLTISIGGALIFFGLIFSIIGLIFSVKNKEAKWMSIFGILLNLSIFGIFSTDWLLSAEPTTVIVPSESVSLKEEINSDVIIEIEPEYVKCINNISEAPKNTEIALNDANFEEEFSIWLSELKQSLNGENSGSIENEGVLLEIRASREVEFPILHNVMDILQKNNLKKFYLSSEVF